MPDSICATDFLHASEEKIYSLADIIITIGGDGTIIRYAKRAALDNTGGTEQEQQDADQQHNGGKNQIFFHVEYLRFL